MCVCVCVCACTRALLCSQFITPPPKKKDANLNNKIKEFHTSKNHKRHPKERK